MIRNYLIIAIRNISRQKLFSFINIFGLAVGLMAVIFIFLWVNDELGFDKFHNNADRIYRVEENQHYSNGNYHVNVTPWISGPVWEERIPEIEKSTRLAGTGNILVKYNDKVFYENEINACDSAFFEMFSFELLKGRKEEVLKGPGKVVISDEMAEKYFGNEDPTGKVLTFNNSDVLEVTGVFRRVPPNSSIRMSMLVSFDYATKLGWYSEHWGNNSITTFVMLSKGSDPVPVDKKLTDIVREFLPQGTTDFMLAPLTKMHLYSWFGYSQQQRGIQSVYIFSIVALFVLIIACINFMNLTTAYSSTRSREIGLRKVTGAHRKDLIYQFLSESIVLSVISAGIAIILVASFIETFNRISGKSINYNDLLNQNFILGIIIITLVTGILSGLYPSLVLSAFKPIKILRGDLGLKDKKGTFRKSTVIIQFSLTILLIIGTAVVYKQMLFMQNINLGYKKDNLFYIPIRGEMREKYFTIRDELKNNPAIESITASSHPPHSIGSNSDNASWEGKDPDNQTLVSFSGVDYDYVKTLGIELKSGREFSQEFATDMVKDTLGAFLVNEEMEKLMGGSDATGKQLRFQGLTGPIVGVMKDYHFQSARNSIEPLAVILAPVQYFGFIIVRIKPGDIKTNMKSIEKSWDAIMPGFPFDYNFVDRDFDYLYKTEERMGMLMYYFAIVSIVIACVGLFGLAGFTTVQKSKEIGIRKVMGATASQIIVLFSRETLKLMIISALIACPVAWWVLHSWLQDFAYRTELNLWIFIAAGFAAIFIALLSIFYQAMKAAMTNPAEIMKYE